MNGIGVNDAGSGNGHQVGVFGLLAHCADGIAGEPDALGGQQVDGLDRDELRARLAPQVDEQREDELRSCLLGQFRQRGEVFRHHDRP